jgi:hypothetical protein
VSRRVLVVEDHEDNHRIVRDPRSPAGYEATRRIKANPALRATPIIAAKNDHPRRAACLRGRGEAFRRTPRGTLRACFLAWALGLRRSAILRLRQ